MCIFTCTSKSSPSRNCLDNLILALCTEKENSTDLWTRILPLPLYISFPSPSQSLPSPPPPLHSLTFSFSTRVILLFLFFPSLSPPSPPAGAAAAAGVLSGEISTLGGALGLDSVTWREGGREGGREGRGMRRKEGKGRGRSSY